MKTLNTVNSHSETEEQSTEHLVDWIVNGLREWKIGLAGVLLGIIGTVFLFLLAPKQYESTAVLTVKSDLQQLPRVYRSLIPTAEAIVAQLIEQYDVNDKVKMGKTLPRLESVFRSENILYISSRAVEPKGALGHLMGVIVRLKEDSMKDLQEALNLQKLSIDQSEKQMGSRKAQIEALSASEKSLGNNELALKGLLAIEKEKALREWSVNEEILFQKKLISLSLHASTIDVVSEPKLRYEGKPAQPRMRWYFVAGALASLFLGIVFIFGKRVIKEIRFRLA
ncbi:MAG: hypothetical protein SGJ02_12270 [bacterium]|nr:hypothetical protein [bacterium]